MDNFIKAFEWLMRLDVEGGYSNDVTDRGGETKYGISKRSYPNVDIEDLTIDEAKRLYLNDYYNKCFCNQMPYTIALAVFDCAVNQGPGIASKLLQEALNKSPINSNLSIDGKIGLRTLMAIKNADEALLFVNFMALRAKRYAQDYLVDSDYGQFKRLFNLTEYLK